MLRVQRHKAPHPKPMGPLLRVEHVWKLPVPRTTNHEVTHLTFGSSTHVQADSPYDAVASHGRYLAASKALLLPELNVVPV